MTLMSTVVPVRTPDIKNEQEELEPKLPYFTSWTQGLFTRTDNDPVTVNFAFWVAWQHMRVFTRHSARQSAHHLLPKC